MYNLTGIGDGGLSGAAETANEFTGGVLFGLLIIGVFFIFFFRLKRWPFEDALAVSCLICFALSAILTAWGVLNFFYPVAFLIVAALTGMYLYSTR